MSATIRLSGKLPGDPEINGLDSQHERLVRDDTALLCLAWVKPTKTVVDRATGDQIPTVELARIEPIGSVTSVSSEIITLAAELYERRTGRSALPIAQLLAPKGDVDEIDDKTEERLVRADVAAAEMLMGMSPEDRDDAMSDGEDNVVQLARGADAIGDVFSFDGEDYGDE